MKKVDFTDKVIWITGASSGIGASLATLFNARGANVIASARRLEKLADLKRTCTNPENLQIVPLDITDEDSIQRAMTLIDGISPIDMVIHNAGIAQKGLVTENAMLVDRQIMETNYFGTVAFTKAILPRFIKQGHGWFTVISSFAGVMGIPGRSAYAASKHALHGFFESLKAENINCKIRVSYAIPGFINTDITAKGMRGDGRPNGSVETSHQQGISSETCAIRIIRGLEKKKRRMVIGKFEVHLLTVNRISPRIGHFIIRNHPMKRIRRFKSRIMRSSKGVQNHTQASVSGRYSEELRKTM